MREQGSIGVIIGNRDFFPDRLVAEARVEIIDLLKKLNINANHARYRGYEAGRC
jgi:L-fucose isomerase-like protein